MQTVGIDGHDTGKSVDNVWLLWTQRTASNQVKGSRSIS